MSIADYIKDDLAVRLRSRQDLPAQLTLDSLAGLYNVSFTPVRTAVAELIHEGLLEKGANRRLIISAAAHEGEEKRVTPLPAKLPEPPRDAYEIIANDLVQLSLEGDAVYLREEVTAEKYGISRSAIRNILHRLAGEGILDHIPRRGWRLRAFRQDDLQAFVEIREVLELKALDLSFSKLDTGELRRMLDSNEFPKCPGARPRIDESLHQYLIVTSGNLYINDFFERQGRYYQLLFQWEDHDFKAAMETVRQHREILSALLAEDVVAARRALSYHILNNHPILSQVD